jgi:hypothetical protein
MNTRLLRRIIGLILAALLLMSIVLLAGTTAAAQHRYQRRVIVARPINPTRAAFLAVVTAANYNSKASKSV